MIGGQRRTLTVAAAMAAAGAAACLASVLPWMAPARAAEAPASQTRPTRHENPATAAADADPAAAFEWYRLAVSRLGSWRFQEGRKIVVRLDDANLPPEILSIVRDANRLIVDESSILEAADRLLRRASLLVEAGRADEARVLLEQLGRYVRRGEILFDDAVGEFKELAKRVNVQALPPDAPQRQAYDDLMRMAARARAMLLVSGAVAGDPAQVAALARLLPYQTMITLSAPATAYPGRVFTVTGNVSEQAPVPSAGRLLSLRLDGAALAELPLGSFRREIAFPPGALPGARIITASVPAQGRYLGATVQRNIVVTRAAPDLSVDLPRYAVAPGRIVMRGATRSALGPAGQAGVEVRIGRTAGQATTSETGGFVLTLDLPSSVSLTGPQRLTLRLLPREPWHAGVDREFDLFVINLVNAGAVALLLSAAGAAGLAYTRGRRRQTAERLGPAIEAGPGRAATPTPPAAVRLAPGLREQIIEIYLDALGQVRAVTGLDMGPAVTMREFARGVRPKIPGGSFAEITALAEVALYSARPITEDHVEQACGLAIRLKGEMAVAVP